MHRNIGHIQPFTTHRIEKYIGLCCCVTKPFWSITGPYTTNNEQNVIEVKVLTLESLLFHLFAQIFIFLQMYKAIVYFTMCNCEMFYELLWYKLFWRLSHFCILFYNPWTKNESKRKMSALSKTFPQLHAKTVLYLYSKHSMVWGSSMQIIFKPMQYLSGAGRRNYTVLFLIINTGVEHEWLEMLAICTVAHTLVYAHAITLYYVIYKSCLSLLQPF